MFTVYLFDQPIGTLEKRGQGVRFTYSEAALENTNAPGLSISLPKRPEPYSDRYAGAFFRNLLPEQSYRRLIASAANTPYGNSLALLGAIGGECPGAVSIWPQDQEPPPSQNYDPLSSDGLRALVGSSSPGDLGSAIARGRLSLPGVQHKIALLRRDGAWMLPKNGAVTSHILKLPGPEFPGLLENELFCMRLAQAVRLTVPDVGLEEDHIRVLWVERFDRISVDGSDRQKLHQEDFCQALRVEPDRKYETLGGPGLHSCAQLIRDYSSLPAEDLPRIAEWVAFNYLIGNEDAHAKNLALLYTQDGLQLSPYYDLVSTGVYAELERSMAMKIGRAWDVRNVQRNDWKIFAKRIALPWDRLRATVLRVSDDITTSVAEVEERNRKAFGEHFICARIHEIIDRHARQLSRELE